MAVGPGPGQATGPPGGNDSEMAPDNLVVRWADEGCGSPRICGSLLRPGSRGFCRGTSTKDMPPVSVSAPRLPTRCPAC